MNLTFVYTELFDRTAGTAFRSERERDEALRRVENELQADPERGDLLQRLGGARKIRVALPGRGKRSGGRAIYVYVPIRSRIYFLMLYPKSRLPTLTHEQETAIRTWVGELKRER